MMIRVGPAMPPVSINEPQRRTAAEGAGQFGQLLAEALGKVEAAQVEAADSAQRLATGEIRDVSDVLIASEKATLALQLTVQVRNKIVEAYQEIMRMPI